MSKQKERQAESSKSRVVPRVASISERDTASVVEHKAGSFFQDARQLIMISCHIAALPHQSHLRNAAMGQSDPPSMLPGFTKLLVPVEPEHDINVGDVHSVMVGLELDPMNI